MLSVSPGNSPQFQVTFEPVGVATSIDQIGWAIESSDGVGDISMTANADDLTGATATMAIPIDITVGATITTWAVYRRLDQQEVLIGPINLQVVSS
jgi:hypothetical protein